MKKHPLHKEVSWIKKNWKYAEICNNTPTGYLVITLCLNENTGQGEIFLQSQISDCIAYIKKKNQESTKQVNLGF